MRLFKGGLAFKKWRAAFRSQDDAHESMSSTLFLIRNYFTSNNALDSGLLLDGSLFADGSSIEPKYEYTASGGIISGGSATVVFTDIREYTASGGITSGGSATTILCFIYTYSTDGGITSGGVATTSVLHIKSYSASGGITSGGTASLEKDKSYSSSGGITAGGIATLLKIKIYAGSGDVTSGGSGTTSSYKNLSSTDTGSASEASEISINISRNYTGKDRNLIIDAPLITSGKDSQDSASTQAPAGMAVIRDPKSEYYAVFYQNGIDGLIYRRSDDGGLNWGNEIVLSERLDVYPSAVVNPVTGDIHVAYSKHGLPETDLYTGWDIYYRGMIWSIDSDDWIVTEEQVVEQATDNTYFTNVSMSVDENGYLFASYGKFIVDEQPKLRTAVSSQPWDLGVSVKKDHYSFPYSSEIRPLTRYIPNLNIYFVLAEQNGFYRIFAGISTISPFSQDLVLLPKQVFGGNDSYEFDAQFNSDVNIINPSVMMVYIGVDGNLHRRFWDPLNDILSEYVPMNFVNSYYPSVSKNGQNWIITYFEQISGNNRIFYLDILEEDISTSLTKTEAASDPEVYLIGQYELQRDVEGHAYSWSKLPPEATYYQQNVVLWCEGIGTYAAGTVSSVAGNNVEEHDTIYVGTQTYRFEDSLASYTGVPNIVLVGADYEESFQNLANAINRTGTPGTDYTAATVANPDATAEFIVPDVGYSYILVTANDYGIAGNDIVFHTQETDIAAQGTLTATSNVANNDTVTIDSNVYTFKNAINNAVADEVLIGASADESLDHLMKAINGGSGSGTEYSTATVANTYASATHPTTTTLLITATTAGNAGNSIVFNEASTHLTHDTYGGANTLGGTTAGITVSGEFVTDGDLGEGGDEVLGVTTAGMERQVYTSHLALGTYRDINDAVIASDSVYVAIDIADSVAAEDEIFFFGEMQTVSETTSGVEDDIVPEILISEISSHIVTTSIYGSATIIEATGTEDFEISLDISDYSTASESLLVVVDKFASEMSSISEILRINIPVSDSTSEIEHFEEEITVTTSAYASDFFYRNIDVSDSGSGSEEVLFDFIFADQTSISESVLIEVLVSVTAEGTITTPNIDQDVSDNSSVSELGIFTISINDTGHISESLEFARSRAATVRLYVSSGGIPLKVEGPLGAAVTTNPNG